MRNQPNQYQQPPPPPAAPKSTFISMVEFLAAVLSIVISLFSSPPIIDLTKDVVIVYLSEIWAAGFSELYFFAWWLVVHMTVYGVCWLVFHIQIMKLSTKAAMRGFNR